MSKKEQGNVAFKSQDYPRAIGFYTAAMLADATDPTIPLNRAAAYLKLFKYEDAERDCTKVLSIDANNVKAFWRRAQSRRELGRYKEAEDDLHLASKIDPKNDAVKLDLEKILALRKKGKSKSDIPGEDIGRIPLRRRVPIEIVEDEELYKKSTSDPVTLKSAMKKTREARIVESQIERPSSLSNSPQPGPHKRTVINLSSETESPRSFTATKSARENARPSLVGGGIFRANGLHTIVDRSASVIERPTNMFNFTRAWSNLGSDAPGERWRLLRTLEPASLPTFMRHSLDESFLASLLQVLDEYSASDELQVKEYVASLKSVSRIETVSLFLKKSDQEIWRRLQQM